MLGSFSLKFSLYKIPDTKFFHQDVSPIIQNQHQSLNEKNKVFVGEWVEDRPSCGIYSEVDDPNIQTNKQKGSTNSNCFRFLGILSTFI